jgi:hypothetical protein
MTPHVRRTMAHLAAWVLMATAGIAASASPAQAFGGETFGCRITTVTWSSPCFNTRGAATYTAGFNVLNLSGSDYTFTWSYSGDYLYVKSGCTPADSGCGLAMANTDGGVVVRVTYTQGGQTGGQQATAIIRQFCGPVLC